MNINDLSDDDLAPFIYMDPELDESCKDDEYSAMFAAACNEAARRHSDCGDVKSWAASHLENVKAEQSSYRRVKPSILFSLMPLFGMPIFGSGSGSSSEFYHEHYEPIPKIQKERLKKEKTHRDPTLKRERKSSRKKAKRKRRKSGLR